MHPYINAVKYVYVKKVDLLTHGYKWFTSKATFVHSFFNISSFWTFKLKQWILYDQTGPQHNNPIKRELCFREYETKFLDNFLLSGWPGVISDTYTEYVINHVSNEVLPIVIVIPLETNSWLQPMPLTLWHYFDYKMYIYVSWFDGFLNLWIRRCLLVWIGILRILLNCTKKYEL